MLDEHTKFLVFWEVHIVDDVLPFGLFFVRDRDSRFVFEGFIAG